MKPDLVRRKDYLLYNLYFFIEHFLGYKLLKKIFKKSLNKLNNDIQRDMEQKNRANFLEVPLAQKDIIINKDKRFKTLINKPLLFKGAAKDWPATQKWSLDFFEKEFGDFEIFVLDTVGAIDRKNPQKFEKLPLKSFIEQMREGSLKYLKFSNIVQKQLKLQEDLDNSWLNKFDTLTSFGRRFYMFIGGKGTITPLHNEFPSVVYIQVNGRKKWILYAPEERIFLNPRTERRHYFYTEADPFEADPQFPLMPYAQRYEVVLEPGDVLWFPPFYWHYVENLSDSIGVAYKFNDIPFGFKASKMLTSLFLMATRPNLIYNFISLRFGKTNVDTKSAHS